MPPASAAATTIAEERTKRAVRRLTSVQPTLGSNIDSMWALRERRRELDAQSKKLAEEEKVLEGQILEQMKAQGVTKTTGGKASVSVTTSVVANVKDWDAFYAYIHKNKYWHLLQQRVSDPAWREVSKEGTKPAPGTEAFNHVRVNLRTLG